MLFDLFPLVPLSRWTPKVAELLVARKWKVLWIKRFPTIGAVPGTTIRDEDDNPLSFMEATNRLRNLQNEIEDPSYAPNPSRTVIPELE